ncbi:MAG: flagellar biosynthesis protein FlhA [Rhodobacteraceae bacterium HLUCCA24]|nr:MAG: flagellar biosynthesis protein FlhA [Rhodobacteraceae bacterium HLUCCA24]
MKGDAIAGLLITLLNLVMGLAMGVLAHDMPMGQAFETYAILTVGDGLVSQIPAVIISIAAGLLLARGGTTGPVDFALVAQLGRYPAALATVALLMALFALVPGLPVLPFLGGAAVLGGAALLLRRRAAQDAARAASEDATPEPAAPAPLGDILEVDDVHLEFAPDLVGMVLDEGTGLDARIANMRRHIASAYGLIMPEIRLTDDLALPSGTYVIRILGVEQGRARLHPEQVLALAGDSTETLPPGDTVEEPVYGAPARWIAAEAQEQAALAGVTVVTPAEVLATHLLETLKRNFGRLLTLRALRRLLDEMVNLSDPARAAANRRLLDELVPDKVPLDVLHGVLRLLLEEQVSIRNLPLILESVAEARLTLASPDAICEQVRQRLGFQLVAALRRDDGTLPLVQLDPDWEETFASYQVDGTRGGLDVALPPDVFNRLGDNVAQEVRRAGERGVYPALVTSGRRRRFLRTVLSAKGVTNPVLSFEEIGLEARPALVGTVAA